MKIFNESILIPLGQTLNIKHIQLKKFDAPYHQHPEYELTYIIRGTGTRFIDGQKTEFQSGDFVLLGPEIPHAWFSDKSCTTSEAIVVQWHKDKIEEMFNGIPEWKDLNDLLNSGFLGINFDSNEDILQSLFELIQLPAGLRLIRLLEILTQLSNQEEHSQQILRERILYTSSKDCSRMSKVLEFISENILKEEISVRQISTQLNMTPSAFCHFFKKRTRKTFTQYINEIKISKSTQLLLRTQDNISEVAFQSGFQNLSHFNRQFLRINGSSPREYRERSQSIINSNERNSIKSVPE